MAKEDPYLNNCPWDEYREPHTMVCKPCSTVCHDVYKTRHDCLEHCSVYFNRVTNGTTTTAEKLSEPTTAKLTTTAATTRDISSSWFELNIAACVVLIIFLVILLVILTYSKNKQLRSHMKDNWMKKQKKCRVRCPRVLTMSRGERQPESGQCDRDTGQRLRGKRTCIFTRIRHWFISKGLCGCLTRRRKKPRDPEKNSGSIPVQEQEKEHFIRGSVGDHRSRHSSKDSGVSSDSSSTSLADSICNPCRDRRDTGVQDDEGYHGDENGGSDPQNTPLQEESQPDEELQETTMAQISQEVVTTEHISAPSSEYDSRSRSESSIPLSISNTKFKSERTISLTQSGMYEGDADVVGDATDVVGDATDVVGDATEIDTISRLEAPDNVDDMNSLSQNKRLHVRTDSNDKTVNNESIDIKDSMHSLPKTYGVIGAADSETASSLNIQVLECETRPKIIDSDNWDSILEKDPGRAIRNDMIDQLVSDNRQSVTNSIPGHDNMSEETTAKSTESSGYGSAESGKSEMPAADMWSMYSIRDNNAEDTRSIADAQSGACSSGYSLLDLHSHAESVIRDDGTEANPRGPPETPPESTWSKVMKLYECIDSQLHRFPWVVGCMVGSEALEVVVDLEEDKSLTLDTAREKLCQEIPPSLVSYMKLTAEGPGISLCCTYGSGAGIGVLNPDGSRSSGAIVTVVGFYSGHTYAFTVGHTMGKDMACYVDCVSSKAADGRTAMGTCVALEYNSENVDLTNIKSKLSDISMVQLNQPVPQDNALNIPVAHGHTGHLLIDRTEVTVHRMHEEVLIFNELQKSVSRGKVSRVYITPINGKLQTNFLHVISTDSARPLRISRGRSGSLVTSLPDKEGVIRAFGYVMGHRANDQTTACMLPLWEALGKVCKDHRGMDFSSLTQNESGYGTVGNY